MLKAGGHRGKRGKRGQGFHRPPDIALLQPDAGAQSQVIGLTNLGRSDLSRASTNTLIETLRCGRRSSRIPLVICSS